MRQCPFASQNPSDAVGILLHYDKVTRDLPERIIPWACFESSHSDPRCFCFSPFSLYKSLCRPFLLLLLLTHHYLLLQAFPKLLQAFPKLLQALATFLATISICQLLPSFTFFNNKVLPLTFLLVFFFYFICSSFLFLLFGHYTCVSLFCKTCQL
jgi:hypothetical protein